MIINDARILVVSPHADDETIGCGGFMAKAVKEYNCQVHIVALAVSDVHSAVLQRVITRDERIAEMRECLASIDQSIGYTIFDYEDGILDTVPIREIITKLDRKIEDFQPSVVLYPYPSHHQDHSIAYQASVAALRPNKRTSSLRLAAVYEYTYYDVWNPFHLNKFSKLYCDITGYIDEKMKALSCYKSQMQRDSQDLLSPDAIRTLSALRGREVGIGNAEVFYLMRGMLL